VAKTFFFMVANISEGLFFCKLFQGEVVRTAEEAFIESADDLAEFSAVGRDADAIAVAFIFAQGGKPANARDACDGVYEFEDALDVLDWDDLAEMVFFHFSSDEAADDGFYYGRGFGEGLKFADAI
jgi:hypothetical protein